MRNTALPGSYYTLYPIRSSNHVICHYSPEIYKEIYRSCMSYIKNELTRPVLYLDNQLKNVERNNCSMTFKLLKLSPKQSCKYFYERYFYVLCIDDLTNID